MQDDLRTHTIANTVFASVCPYPRCGSDRLPVHGFYGSKEAGTFTEPPGSPKYTYVQHRMIAILQIARLIRIYRLNNTCRVLYNYYAVSYV